MFFHKALKSIKLYTNINCNFRMSYYTNSYTIHNNNNTYVTMFNLYTYIYLCFHIQTFNHDILLKFLKLKN